MSSPGTESGQQSGQQSTEQQTQAPPPAVTPPVQTPPPAADNSAGESRNSRELLASINALPEKLANVLAERNPVPSTPASTPAQVGSNSPGVGGASAGSQSSPGQANGGSPPNTTTPPADASQSVSKFVKFWFGG